MQRKIFTVLLCTVPVYVTNKGTGAGSFSLNYNTVCFFPRSWGDFVLDIFPGLMFDSMKNDIGLRRGLPRNLLTVRTLICFVFVVVFFICTAWIKVGGLHQERHQV